MSLFCNPCRKQPAQQACDCSCAQQNANCCNGAAVAGATTTAEPETVTVRALLQTVLDSCCTTEDVCREIKIDCPEIFDPCDLEIGSVLHVELDDDITYKEIKREKEDCTCVSTLRYNVPIRIYGEDRCGCGKYICRNITVIRSAKLCCAENSILTTNNSDVLAMSAVVTEMCGNEITLTLCLLFRSCVQQTIFREYTWEATPVCSFQDCGSLRSAKTDPCDLTCGCVAGATCPSCN